MKILSNILSLLQNRKGKKKEAKAHLRGTMGFLKTITPILTFLREKKIWSLGSWEANSLKKMGKAEDTAKKILKVQRKRQIKIKRVLKGKPSQLKSM